jgi:hypothetical protein
LDGFYVIAISPLAEALALAEDIIQSKDIKGLTFLVQGYKNSLNSYRWQHLTNIIDIPNREIKKLHIGYKLPLKKAPEKAILILRSC